MQKSKIYLVFAVNVISWAALVLLLLPDAGLQASIVVSVGMILVMVAPIVVVNIAIDKLVSKNENAASELMSLKSEFAKLKLRFDEVTTIDELTGCANRHHFLDLVGQHIAMSERGVYDFTMAIIQIDQFSDIVERQGLARGNEVLQLFARIVESALREVDAVARLESDKFGLILSGSDEKDALVIINRISMLIRQIKVGDDDEMKLTLSGGISLYHGAETVAELIAHAEEALEFAVDQGRDRVAGYNYTEVESTVP